MCPPYPHPYIMDLTELDRKTNPTKNEKLRKMIRQFGEYHAFTHHAQRLLSYNIDQLASGKEPLEWPENPDGEIPKSYDPIGPWQRIEPENENQENN